MSEFCSRCFFNNSYFPLLFKAKTSTITFRSLLKPFFFSSRRRHTILQGDWSSDVCSSDLTSFSQVPAEASGQSLFGVFQAFRAWSVQQTYGQLTADVRNITASTPLYYYYGGGFSNATSYANNPDTFFQLAKQ